MQFNTGYNQIEIKEEHSTNRPEPRVPTAGIAKTDGFIGVH